ncbi:hypothetical protein Tco_0319086 [Tanacetum coccineum]
MGKFIKELFINRWDSNRKDIRSLATTKVESEHPKWFQMQISLTNVKANKPNVRAVTTLKYKYIVQSYRGRTQSLVAKKKDILKNRASRNFDLMIIK